MKLFDQENFLNVILNKIGDIIISNLLFIICCIPVITIGPALTALYHCMLRTVKGNNYKTTKTFITVFKQNFIQSLIIWIGILTLGFVLFLNIQFLMGLDSPFSKILFYLSGLVVALLAILFLYIFPVIAAFDNTTGKLLRNAFIFAFMHFPSTLGIMLVSFLPMFMTYQDLELLPLYAFCWFFFGFALTGYINAKMFYPMFRPYLNQNPKE